MIDRIESVVLTVDNNLEAFALCGNYSTQKDLVGLQKGCVNGHLNVEDTHIWEDKLNVC